MKLTFLGAAGGVTGSCYLIESKKKKILIDHGLFQGFKDQRLFNWANLKIPANSIDAIVLTHAHLDHSGRIPKLVNEGFRGSVYCTPPTRDLAEVLLLDCGYLQEEDARLANKFGYSKHNPAVPLYTAEDAKASLRSFVVQPFGAELEITDGIRVQFSRAGHIPGASWVTLKAENRTVVFSGDQGRPDDLLLKPSVKPTEADFLIMESTYGDRLHEVKNPVEQFGGIINRTIGRGGSIIIPAFSVGRAQSLVHYIHKLKSEGTIPAHIPVYLDSPMAISATEILKRYPNEHRLDAKTCESVFDGVNYTHTPAQSAALSMSATPKIIIAGAGMMTGGRVLHHVKQLGNDPRNTILLAGYQANGTRGRKLLDGAREIKIHGALVPIAASVEVLKGASAHADCQEMINWVGHIKKPPITTFITHGEPKASEAMKTQLLAARPGWQVVVPTFEQAVTL